MTVFKQIDKQTQTKKKKTVSKVAVCVYYSVIYGVC